MRSERAILAFGAAVLSAVSCLAAPQKTRCFDRPWVVVADDFGAFFRDGKYEMTKEGVEAYADAILAGGKVTHVFWCPVAGRANFAAKATDPIWAGLDDPATEFGVREKVKDGPLPVDKPEAIAANKRWAENAKKLNDAGIDPYRVWIARTRAKGASPWLTIRVTDLCCAILPHHFRTPSFFAQHPEFLLGNGSHGGGSVDFAKDEARAWLTRVIGETAARYKDIDGVELDLVTGNAYWTFLPDTLPDGRQKRELFNGYLKEIRKVLVEQTENRVIKIALRVVHDTNLVGRPLFLNADLSMPVDLLIPWSDGTFAPTLAAWADMDRYGVRRIMPAVSAASVGVPRLAGRLSWVRGYDFPGVVITTLDRASDEVRKAVLADGLADLDKGVRGPRELVLVRNEHMMEWKRAAWGYVDCRTTYPWKLDRPWKYEFALQEGSVAEKGVTVSVTYGKGDIPETIYLNGRKPLSCKKSGAKATYAFANDAVFGWVNQLYIPAQGPDTTATVTSASVKIDL